MLNPEVVSELLLCVKVDVAFEWAEQGFLGNSRDSRGLGRVGQMMLHGQVLLNCRVNLTCANIGKFSICLRSVLKVNLNVSFEGKF